MRNLRSWHKILAVGLTLLGAVGCGKKEGVSEPAGPPPSGEGGGCGHHGEGFRTGGASPRRTGRPATDKSALLQEMIEREVMLQKAKSDEAMKDPEVQRSLENQLLTHWLDGIASAGQNQVTVNDDELRAAYEADLASHTRPATIRVAMLYRKVNASDAPEERESVRAALLAARDAYLRDRPPPRRAGASAALAGGGGCLRGRVSRYRGGDIGWHQPGQENYRWPKPVMEAAFALNKGEPSDAIEFEDGLYVVMKSDERPSFVTPFEEAKVTMRRRMIRDKQAAVESQFRSNSTG